MTSSGIFTLCTCILPLSSRAWDWEPLSVNYINAVICNPCRLIILLVWNPNFSVMSGFADHAADSFATRRRFRFFSACHKLYCSCWLSQLSALVLKAIREAIRHFRADAGPPAQDARQRLATYAKPLRDGGDGHVQRFQT